MFSPFSRQRGDNRVSYATLLAKFGLVLLLIGYEGFLAWLLLHTRPILDEGWYLYAAWQIAEGKWLYHDFAFLQGPLFPLLHGGLMPLLGHELLAHRLFDAVFSLGLLGTLMLSSYRKAGTGGAGLTLMSFGTSFLGALTLSRATNFPMSVAFACLGVLLALPLEEQRAHPGRTFLAGVLLALSAAARLSFVPLGLVVGLLVIEEFGRRMAVRFAWGFALTAFLLWGPFLAIDPFAVYFNVFTLQAARARWAVAPLVALPLWEWALTSLSIYLFAAGGAISSLALTPKRANVYLLLCAGAAYFPLLLTGDLWPHYPTVALPFLALAAGVGIPPAWPRLKPYARMGMVALLGLLVSINIMAGFLFARSLPLARAWDAREFRAVACEIRSYVRPEEYIVGFYTPLPFQAGRHLWPGWEMSLFSYVNLETSLARRYRLLNPELIQESLREEAVRLVIMSDSDLSILYAHKSSPRTCQTPLPTEALLEYFPELAGRVEKVRVIPCGDEFNNNIYLLFLKSV
ncbi:MAG: hypothetical protein ACUVV0_10725 [Anaerolineae bacterium]